MNQPRTPFEQGNGNQTVALRGCIAFYEELAARYPHILRLWTIGESDNGLPIHAGLVSADGVFEREAIHAAGRPVFFNNNGIHPGEPEGIDACMALVRDFCVEPARLAALGRTVFLFIAVYNVDGCLERNTTSRVNQDGPESFGFRGNALHLDLNRDFIKCDSLNAQAFNRFFTQWDPDVMVDTHTSNGADYAYTMTLIPTQPDKLGGELGGFLRSRMLPRIYAGMEARGWPTCPYVNPLKETPDDGIVDFLETARFSTGYAALHHCIGFMPETHMLKPFADRYAAMRALVEEVLAFTVEHGTEIRALRAAARAARPQHWPLRWKMAADQHSNFRFKGYAARYSPSLLGDYQRLSYDRSQPWEKDIAHYDRFMVWDSVDAPRAYVLPRAWRLVAERLQWNGVRMESLQQPRTVQVRRYRIAHAGAREGAYEGHMFHDEVMLDAHEEACTLQAGDWWIPLDQPRARYVVETLEPLAHDSLFRWGFFNSVLEQKEHYSDYVFEDRAHELLQQEPALRAHFDAWKAAHPELLRDQAAVLDFLFAHCAAHAEPGWRRYPVLAVL